MLNPIRKRIWLVAALCLAPMAALAQSASPAPQTRFVVVLDAAHGGGDSGGKLASGKLEKDVVLAFSVRLRSLLAARGIPVITTRESDAAPTADERAQAANRAQAGACLILHTTESGTGIHFYVSSLSPNQPGHFVAWKTAQAAYVQRSLALAGRLNSSLHQVGFTVQLGRTSLPGLDSITCPAVAVELAPDRDASRAIKAEPDSSDYQTRAANALAAALLAWRAEVRQP